MTQSEFNPSAPIYSPDPKLGCMWAILILLVGFTIGAITVYKLMT